MGKNTSSDFTLSPANFYSISFVEGAAVMIIELLGAKIIAPYFGASLYVWASVLGLTLLGLAAGYFTGGVLSRKENSQLYLFSLLLGAGFFGAIAPLIAPKLMLMTEPLGVRGGAFASVLIYLFPSVFCCGAISPILIQELARLKVKPGKASGTVYAVSTLGGILATFIFGYYVIPEIGIKKSAMMVGLALGGGALAYFIFTRKFKGVGIAVGLALVVAMLFPKYKYDPKGDYKVTYNTEGILGELTVLDVVAERTPTKVHKIRKLLLNGIDQTNTQVGFEPLSLWHYPHKLSALAAMKPKGSKALLLGMGGGSIAFELIELGFDLDIVELDPRVPDIIKKYFKYDPSRSTMIIDDARHYMSKTDEKYDVAIFDVVSGESQPSHVFTAEGFEVMKSVLNENAIVLINFQGNLTDPTTSLGPRSVFKTMQAAGFDAYYYAGHQEEDRFGDIYFLGAMGKVDLKTVLKTNRYNAWFPYNDFFYDDLITGNDLDTEDAYLLIDDKPQLELLNTPTILDWRKNMMEQNAQSMVKNGVPIFR